jgi:hypothetical protein
MQRIICARKAWRAFLPDSSTSLCAEEIVRWFDQPGAECEATFIGLLACLWEFVTWHSKSKPPFPG